jgi:hypothetical protein
MYIERLGSWEVSRADTGHACWTCGLGRMTALHIRYTWNEELWGSRAGEGGRHIFYILSLKEILIRRQRNIWDVDYLLLLLLVEARWICASSHPLITYLYGTISSNERKAPNKAAP